MGKVILIHESGKEYGPFHSMDTMIENVAVYCSHRHAGPVHKDNLSALGFVIKNIEDVEEKIVE